MFPPALAEPRRQHILRLLWDGAEHRAGDIAGSMPEVSFPAVSQHLARLLTDGLVVRRRQGREVYYRSNREALGPLAAVLDQLWGERLASLKQLAEAEESRGASRAARNSGAGSPDRRSSHGRRQRRR